MTIYIVCFVVMRVETVSIKSRTNNSPAIKALPLECPANLVPVVNE
jgi:hypothetical protein